MEHTIDSDYYHPMLVHKPILQKRLSELSADDLRKYKDLYGSKLGNSLSRIVDGLIYNKSPRGEMPTEDIHPDGWYDR